MCYYCCVHRVFWMETLTWWSAQVCSAEGWISSMSEWWWILTCQTQWMSTSTRSVERRLSHDELVVIHFRLHSINSPNAGWQGGAARTQRNGDHLRQQQQQTAVPGGGEPGEAHWFHPAPAAPQLTTPPWTTEEGETEGQTGSGWGAGHQRQSAWHYKETWPTQKVVAVAKSLDIVFVYIFIIKNCWQDELVPYVIDSNLNLLLCLFIFKEFFAKSLKRRPKSQFITQERSIIIEVSFNVFSHLPDLVK